MEDKYVRVKEWDIHYRRVGRGPKYLLCLTGGLGIGSTFDAMMEQFDPDLFTVIAWDPPGYGLSRPPNRVQNDYLVEEDAEYVFEFMKALQIPSSSVLGFCWGGRVAMILAVEHPNMVDNLILISTSSYLLPHEIEIQRGYVNIEIWSSTLKESLRTIYNYSDDDMKELAQSRFNINCNIYQKRNGDVCTKALELIRCKTLVLAGQTDPFSDISHAYYLTSNIKGSRMHLYPDGGHYIHIKYAEDVMNKIVQFIGST